MVAGWPGGRQKPPLPPRHGLTLRQRAGPRSPASLTLLLWLLGSASAVGSAQLDSVLHGGCVRDQTGSACAAHRLERPLGSNTHLSTGQDGEQLAGTWSRRLLLTPDGQTAQQTAQQAVNR